MRGLIVLGLIVWGGIASAQVLQSNVMSAAYWQFWNAEVQRKIDVDIEAHRKADYVFAASNLAAGTEVSIEQISHEFIFGAHIFNFNQLGSDELNAKYQALFGTFLNSATIAFYWQRFEWEEGKPRFQAEYRDSAEFWNKCPDPKTQFHWRRPATDPIVEFCESKGIRLHGHVLCWGSYKWQMPQWLLLKGAAELDFLKTDRAVIAEQSGKLIKPILDEMEKLSVEEIEKRAPAFTKALNEAQDKRIREIAAHYKGRLQSWDVANESGCDYKWGRLINDRQFCKSHYGPMPGDYAYKAFQTAQKVFPPNVLLNINDFTNDKEYVQQIKEMQARGCKIDIVGTQKHYFNPQTSLDIAAGKPIGTPDEVWAEFAVLAQAGLPLHRSEVTITSPNNDARGQAIQAVIAYNLYRLWFSIKPMMGITWWNLVDDCGAPGEPSVSGMFSRQMEPKPVFHALNQLIHTEWKTKLSAKADAQGVVRFRGFKGKYRAAWQDATGKACSAEFIVR